MQNWIGLIDCNNFFVSCERLFRPDLKGKPVVVLSSNDGCVVARSQEIKDAGIAMGVPYFQVKDIIKDIGGITFSSNFALYRDVSRRVFEVVSRELSTVEQYSIDEAFFSFEGTEDEVRVLCSDLKKVVESEVGIPVSIGVAASRTQAKYANAKAKKTTEPVLVSENVWKKEMDQITLASLWGVGASTAWEYAGHSLSTVSDLLALEFTQVERIFGVAGAKLYLELKGQSNWLPTRTKVSQKSILHSRSFKNTTTKRDVVEDAVAYHVREAAEDLRSMGMKTSSLQVSIRPSRHGDYVLQGGTQVAVLAGSTDDTFTLLKAAKQLVDQLFVEGVPYKKAGVYLGGLTSNSVEQLSMFTMDNGENVNGLSAALDQINSKLGKGSVLIGSRLRSESWGVSKDLKSPDYTTKWTDIVSARA